ncbi:hypothetical protein B566_EDAN011182 [Ephemera danica]|nr:hypothetical protein B566_EDAN011182 [Ephemera danica]
MRLRAGSETGIHVLTFPPENELRKVSERQLSEHELRVQRSLQRLNVPEWYKNSANNSSFILKRTGSGSKPGGWQGLNSKTTSLSSLQQQSPSLRSKYSRETTATSPSPVMVHLEAELWTNVGQHFAQRVHEVQLPLQATVPRLEITGETEVQSSIKEVTSAIVHYVKEKNLSPANTRPGDLDRSPSPRGSKTRVWVESSFVGSRPIDSPQTPQIVGESESTNGYEKVDHSTDVLLGHPGYPGDMLQTTYMDIHNGSTKIHSNGEFLIV